MSERRTQQINPATEAKLLRGYIKKVLVEKGGVKIIGPNECRRRLHELSDLTGVKPDDVKPIVHSILQEMLDNMFNFGFK